LRAVRLLRRSPTTLVEKRLSSAEDETVREVAVGVRPAVALREADSQTRRVAVCDQFYTAPHEGQTRGPPVSDDLRSIALVTCR
jgi:hypothetical protein